jgi:hypothetical protein
MVTGDNVDVGITMLPDGCSSIIVGSILLSHCLFLDVSPAASPVNDVEKTLLLIWEEIYLFGSISVSQSGRWLQQT